MSCIVLLCWSYKDLQINADVPAETGAKVLTRTAPKIWTSSRLRSFITPSHFGMPPCVDLIRVDGLMSEKLEIEKAMTKKPLLWAKGQ